MYDVIFVNVHRTLGNLSYSWQSCLGLMSMAAFLEKNGATARVVNCTFYELMDMLTENFDVANCKMFGLYCDFDNVREVAKISAWVKEHRNIPVVVGGPQSKHLGKEFFIKSKCDAVVRGEGELTIIDLANLFLEETGAMEDIRGIAYLKDGQVVINEEQLPIDNLDLLPMCHEKYMLDIKGERNVWVCMTGRGCPFACSFCFEALRSNSVRFRSVENVLDELKERFHQDSEYKYLMFADDTFTLSPERVKALCEGIKSIREKKDFVWYCEGHIRTLLKHPEMIDYMVDAGMVRLQLGIESGNERVLAAYNKGCTPQDIISLIELCKAKGVKGIYGNIILGSAFFSEDTYRRDLAFAKQLIRVGEGMVDLAVVYYWPLPGTRMTNCPEKYGITIEDSEFVTAMMDLPQTSTAEHTLWDIQKLGREFNNQIRALVIDMMKTGTISRDKISEWFFIYKKYNNGISLWLDIVMQYPEMRRYFELLADGSTVMGNRLTDCELYEMHPMRLVNLFEQFDGKKINDILHDIVLDKLDLEILRYSFGKLSAREVLDMLKNETGIICGSEEEYRDIFISRIRRLEECYLIAFGRY